MILDEVERGHGRTGAPEESDVDGTLNGVAQIAELWGVPPSPAVDTQLSAVGEKFGSAQAAPLRTQELLSPKADDTGRLTKPLPSSL